MTTIVTNLDSKRARMKDRLKGSNVSETTFLATDYLNHFNEVFMLLEMLPDMPEMFEEIEHWQPKSYIEHFQDASFADAKLAIEAYQLCPDQYRLPFDRITEILEGHLLTTISKIKKCLKKGNETALRQLTETAIAGCGRLMDALNAIIHANKNTVDQDAIDTLLNDDFVFVNRA